MRIKPWSIAISLIAMLNSMAQARYYDAGAGRFISPDTTVQTPFDPQTLNRYSYVRNNPMLLTDPSGHSWLSSAINKVGQWVGQHREFSGLTWQTFDPFFGSAYLASFENGRSILAGQVIAAGSFGFGGTAVGWGAVSGEISSAYIARKTGADMMAATIRGGVEGAAISATFSGLSNTSASWVVKGLEKSAISAGLTAAQGGSAKGIEMSAALTFAAEAANSYFTRTVGYGPDPTPGTPLGNDGGGDFTYDAQISPQPPLGKDVFGENTVEFGPLHQGAPIMRAASMIPGMQSVSQLHDTLLNTNAAYAQSGSLLINIGTMLPAFAVSYIAQFSGSWSPALIFLNDQ